MEQAVRMAKVADAPLVGEAKESIQPAVRKAKVTHAPLIYEAVGLLQPVLERIATALEARNELLERTVSSIFFFLFFWLER